MLKAEAAWLATQLRRLPAHELSPLLSVGSGGTELRATQPWIEQVIYEPLRLREIKIFHHELQPGPGVDVAGDLTDPAFLGRLPGLEVRSVMCCNVLEHLLDPQGVAAALGRTVAPGGYALVSVPRRYPYHPGPIDTLFRPTPDELRQLFPTLSYESGAEIRCESLVRYMTSSSTKAASLMRGLRTRTPAEARVPVRETLRMALLSTAVSAVVLRAPVLPSGA